MLRYAVKLPLGLAEVELERSGLSLGDRGGFEARWVEELPGEAKDLLEPNAFRLAAKAHLAEVYRLEQGGEAPGVLLNLASHQLLEDLLGWARLNAPAHAPKPD